MYDLTDNPDIETNDFVVARNAGEALHRHYPGHVWAVTCEGRTGVMTIRELRLSPTYGYYIRLVEIYADPAMRCVIQAGGEILERFYQRRGSLNESHIAALPTGADGFPKFDTAGMTGPLPSWARTPNIIKAAEWHKAPK